MLDIEKYERALIGNRFVRNDTKDVYTFTHLVKITSSLSFNLLISKKETGIQEAGEYRARFAVGFQNDTLLLQINSEQYEIMQWENKGNKLAIELKGAFNLNFFLEQI